MELDNRPDATEPYSETTFDETDEELLEQYGVLVSAEYYNAR